MNPLGMEYLTMFGTHPLEYARIAAEVGCASISLIAGSPRVEGLPVLPPSPVEDAALRRELASVLADLGLQVAMVDGFAVRPDSSVEKYAPWLENLAELGATRIGTMSLDDDRGRACAEIAALADMAMEYGVTVAMEPSPTSKVTNLEQALEVLEAVRRSNLKLVIDTMHIGRTGGAPQLPLIDRDAIGYVQICDSQAGMPSFEDYCIAARHERQVPGEGELPLVDMLMAVPDDVIVSVEVPMRSLREAGVTDLERSRRAVAGARRVLQAVDERRKARG